MDVALSRCAGLLPGDTRRVLLLALALLLDLRDPATARRPALRLLPAPPGSPLARLCSAGVPATDLQLFRCWVFVNDCLFYCGMLQLSPHPMQIMKRPSASPDLGSRALACCAFILSGQVMSRCKAMHRARSAQELQELQCPPLEASIMRERLRMTALHGMLFPGVLSARFWMRPSWSGSGWGW